MVLVVTVSKEFLKTRIIHNFQYSVTTAMTPLAHGVAVHRRKITATEILIQFLRARMQAAITIRLDLRLSKWTRPTSQRVINTNARRISAARRIRELTSHAITTVWTIPP